MTNKHRYFYMLKKINLLYCLILLSIMTGLSGCALQKELPPANDQSEIDQTFQDAIKKNKAITQQHQQAIASLKAENEILLDALLPPISQSQEIRFNMAVNNLPAQQFFMGLVEDTDTNIIVNPEVTGNITLNLKNVSIDEVLSIVKEVYGFNYKKRANNYFIYPNTMQTRLFQINYINLIRSGSSSIDVSSGQITKSEGNSSSSVNNQSDATLANTKFGTQLKTEFNVDLWKELSVSLRTIIGNKDGRDIVINPQTGIILVKAMPDELSRVEEFLNMTQMITSRQVLLEAKIVEVELSDGFQAGISWAALGKPGDGKTITGGQVGINQIARAININDGVTTLSALTNPKLPII